MKDSLQRPRDPRRGVVARPLGRASAATGWRTPLPNGRATAPLTSSCIFATSMIDWDDIRKQFPVTQNSTYLNAAAAGPLSRATMEAATEYYRQMMDDD